MVIIRQHNPDKDVNDKVISENIKNSKKEQEKI